MRWIRHLLVATCVLFFSGDLSAQSDSLSYCDEYADAYYPGTDFPSLITPQWVGEAGVDAVVTLAIDDMRDTAKYEAYLRPILERLKKIDGRAPVSIMTCSVDPKDSQLQTWIAEGLSIEVHTVDHPCPCLQGGDFAKAKSTYDRCVDMMASIKGNKPVAFRTPCCDSKNTPSPRLWQEVFNRRTDNGNFLQADSSVFNVFTAADQSLPRELAAESDGSSRFKKYIPFPSFVNTIENYPYPYVIGKLCWQFPCMVPSDWEAQHLHQPNNPKTVADMKAALDATVIKQGMFNLVFHPHGWIRNDQVNEIIDYAQAKYGKRVKFLTFGECIQRLNEHLLLGQPLREPDDGSDNGVRIVDLNADGHLDVMIGNDNRKVARVWQSKSNRWNDFEHGVQFTAQGHDRGVRFGRLGAVTTLLVNNEHDQSLYEFAGNQLKRNALPEELRSIRTSADGVDQGVRLRDLDRDGVAEIIVGNSASNQIVKRTAGGSWEPFASMPFAIVDNQGRDNGVRFVDFDKDGHDDLIVANGSETGVRLYDTKTGGFTREVKDLVDVPMIVRDGTNNGAWFAADHMWVQNENTHQLPDGVDRRSFEQLLGTTEPGPRSPDLSLNSIQVRPGFAVELMAAEPLVMDPIALDWGADGKLWIVEMADYPLGLDDNGKPGGRVRYLEDTDGDGKYDKSTLFLDQIAYPTGVIAWKDGVIVSAAPAVFFAADRDGDGKAEVREDLYRGFGEGNQQHRVNGFERGLDNWIYLSNGDSGGTIESVKTGEKVEIGGRDLRIRPDDGLLDAQAGRTQFGRHRDDHGNWFGCSNPLPVRHYVLADHYLRRNPHVAYPSSHRDIARVDNTQLFPISRVLSHWSGYKPPAPGTGHKFTSACSTMVYRDDLFGEDFRQNTFTCEPVHNAVHRRQLVPVGVSFESTRPVEGVEFLASSDSWFRPATVTTGPDGALWIVDMYRLVIEHPQWIDDQREKELFLRAGHDRGRIYRVYPTDQQTRPIKKLGELGGEQLAEQLSSPNGRVRDLAQHLLIQRNDAEDMHRLENVVRSSTNPLARLHALCTLDGLELRVETLQIALADQDATVRRHAIRIAQRFMHEQDEKLDEVLSALEECKHSDPHIRLQLAYTLGSSSSPRATRLLAGIAGDSTDKYLRAAVLSSLNAKNVNGFYAAISDRAMANEYLVPLLEMAVRLENEDLVSKLMTKALVNCGASPSVADLNTLATALATVRQRNIQLRQSQEHLLANFGKELSRVASDSTEKTGLRAAAISVLALVNDEFRAEVLELIAATEPVEIQMVAARSVISTDADAVLQRFRLLSPNVRTTILDAVLARESTSMKLVKSLETQSVPLQAIGAIHRQKMRTHASKKVSAAAAKLFGEMATSDDKQAVLRRYRKATPLDGDAQIGQAVFTKHCAACHQIKKIGHHVGPDLTALKNRSPHAITTAVFDPNAAVEDKYRSYNVLSLDGVIDAGIIASESGTAIELKMQNGNAKSILRSEIERVQSTGKSMMPEEMEKNISLSDMNHLLAFLNEIGPPAKQFDGNSPSIVTASDDGTLTLAATSCRIYGDQIRFEPQYKNVGYWNRADDQVEWTLNVQRSGKYEVWLDYACPDHTAGNQFIFMLGDQSLAGKIAGTGTWDDYVQVQLGTIELPTANVIAVFKANGELRKSLLDLRTILLKPMK